jgi:predicted Zn-dependent protease with MMP-like domain
VVEISEDIFGELYEEAIAAIPKMYKKRLQNVAFLAEDFPSEEQRHKLNLLPHETLFGLYEGVPLPARNGSISLLPDKITIFKQPLLSASRSLAELRINIGHTVWHEVAHYYGLDHDRIHALDAKRRQRN